MSSIPTRVRLGLVASVTAVALVIPTASFAETELDASLGTITVTTPGTPDQFCQPDSPGKCNTAPGQVKKKECTIDPATGQVVCRDV